MFTDGVQDERERWPSGPDNAELFIIDEWQWYFEFFDNCIEFEPTSDWFGGVAEKKVVVDLVRALGAQLILHSQEDMSEDPKSEEYSIESLIANINEGPRQNG